MKNKISNKITSHTFDIIFGILAGSGLHFIINAITIVLILIAPILQVYSTIIYIVLYLFVLISTSILYTKKWFRLIYLTSASILLIVYIFNKLFI
jgi:hypothetical protein